MKAMTQKDKKSRRLFIVLPILVLPFICMLFWALDGGMDASAKDQHQHRAGLNTELPKPSFEHGAAEDKMSFYQQAAQDSQKLQEQIRNDPYYQAIASQDSLKDGSMDFDDPTALAGSYGSYQSTGDANVDKINDRLSKLYTQLNEPTAATSGIATQTTKLDQMQAMLQAMGQTGNQDPEMAQLDGMLEKILDIQNPDRAREKVKEQSLKNRKQVFPVLPKQQKDPVSMLPTQHSDPRTYPSGNKKVRQQDRPTTNGFYEWSEASVADEGKTNAVAAVIQQTATVVSGATIKLRLSDNIYINGTSIAGGTFVYGTCALSGDRLMISLNSIRYKNALFPVNLIAYDMDGIAGIYMPGAISRDVAKNSAQDAVQGVDYYAMDNSITAQATSVGIQAAKSLLSKKAKLIKVTVKAGYKVLLKDANAQD